MNTFHAVMCSRSSCVNDFIAGRKCLHGFKHCKSCNELWLCNAYTADSCTRHLSYEGEVKPDMEEIEKLALSTVKPYNHDDIECDEVCWHAFDTLKYHLCRHEMTRCEHCGNIWDGFAQCNCFMESGNESTDVVDRNDGDNQPDSTVSEN